MYNAEWVEWARNGIQAHKIPEQDIFNEDKEEKLCRYFNVMAKEHGLCEEVERLKTAIEVIKQHPSKEIIEWAEDILEWDGLGLEKGGDLEPGGYVEWYRRTYMQEHKDEEISVFYTATRVACAMRADSEAMEAAKVRHVEKALQRESARKEYVASQLKHKGFVTWDD